MKNFKSLVAVLIAMVVMVSTFIVPTFAATGADKTEVLSGVIDKHIDLKTGVSFDTPEEWVVSVSNMRRSARDGTSYMTRNIYVFSSNTYSPDYNYQIQIRQTGKNSTGFVVTIGVNGLYDETYFLSPDGLLLLDESDRPLIGEPVTVTGAPIDPETLWYKQWKSVQGFLLSLRVQE